MKMKIAVIGAQGVGKTTLCNALGRERSDVHVVSEVIRDCPYPTSENADFRTQWWAMSHQILAEQEASASGKDFIVLDRSLIDVAVFTSLVHKNNPRAITLAQRNLIFESISNWLSLSPYHKVYNVKVDPLIWRHRELGDGFRSTNLDYYLQIEQEFRNVVAELEVSEIASFLDFDNNGSLEVSLRRFLLEFDVDMIRNGALAAAHNSNESQVLRV